MNIYEWITNIYNCLCLHAQLFIGMLQPENSWFVFTPGINRH